MAGALRREGRGPGQGRQNWPRQGAETCMGGEGAGVSLPRPPLPRPGLEREGKQAGLSSLAITSGLQHPSEAAEANQSQMWRQHKNADDSD